jgi:hypothetical protein
MTDAGWTLDTLKTHIESKIEAVEKNAALALSASEKAITKAEAAAEKRADASNEIRQAMIDQQGNFALRSETEFRLAALERVAALSSGKSAGVGMMVAIGVGCVTVGGVIASLIITVIPG